MAREAAPRGEVELGDRGAEGPEGRDDGDDALLALRRGDDEGGAARELLRGEAVLLEDEGDARVRRVRVAVAEGRGADAECADVMREVAAEGNAATQSRRRR